MRTVEVGLSPAYGVRVGGGLLSSVGVCLRTLLPDAETPVVVTDGSVAALWADKLEEGLRTAGYAPVRFVLPAGETAKRLEHYFTLLRFLAEEGLTRTDAVLALGGGTVSDTAGFAAATYLRGLPLITLPTTLLAMADAAVGGKTGIDLPEGKNLVGAFYQPAAVYCDTDALCTLPRQSFTDGCAEVLKYAVLGDRALFDALRQSGQCFPRERVIADCVAMKAAFVAADEHDRGARKMLNLGHTVAHALEARSGYAMPHGAAVAVGLAVIARASAAAGICPPDCAAEILAALSALELPTVCPCGMEELRPYLAQDKKRRGGVLNLIVPEAVGRCRIEPLPLDDAVAFLKAGL